MDFQHEKSQTPRSGFFTSIQPFLQRPKHLLSQTGRRTSRVLADARLLLSDHREQAIQRLLSHIVLDIRAFRVDHPEARGLAGEAVVLLGQTDLVGGLLDDGQELGADLFAAGLVQVLGGGVLRAAGDALGVLHGHLLHRVHQQRLGLRHGGFGGFVHARFKLINLRAHAHHLHGLCGFAEVARQFDAHVRVVAEAAGFAQLLHGYFGALGEGVLEAAAGVTLGQIGEGQGESAAGEGKAGGEGKHTKHGGHP